MTVAGACVLALAALAVAAPAAHAEVAAPLEIDACPPRAVDLPEATLIERAGQAYDRGEVLYVQGDYAAAIDAFVESYCTVPYYTVLKDVGQAYERLLEYERAIAYLERYVASVPDDATRGGACAPEPREDRANVAARVRVLAGLPAKLRITTSPDGARVTLRRGDTVVARVVTGQGILEARAGTYAMTIERDGFEPITTEVTAAIGKPYSYYFQLTPRRGTLRVRVQPPDARVFVDARLMGIGDLDLELPGGAYDVMVEAAGYVTRSRRVEVAAEDEIDVAMPLLAPPRSGHTQLVIGTGIFGAALGGLGGDVVGDTAGAGLGALLGGGLGALGTYLAVPESISLGMSSYVITATMAGAIFGGALGVGIEGGDAGLTLGAGAGLAVGGGLGGLTARRLRPSVGDAAILNSGVVWGSVTGALFSVVFDGSRRLDGAMVLGGLGTGALAGALLGRSYEASRRHVMLVDLAGLGGAVAASALQSVLVDGSATTDESRAHYALAGLGVGLLAGALLTRNVDDPRLAPRGAVPQAARVSPSVAPVASMADGRGGGLTFGVVGAL